MCGEGLGHTSRCLALGEELISAGHEVHFGAYGYSKELIEKKGYSAHEIPSEITLVGKGGAFDMKASIGATLKNTQLLGGPRILKLVKDLRPDIVVSDSYYLGIISAKARKLPIYLIVNQSNMEEFFKNRGASLRILGELSKKFYTRIFEKVDRIIIPDYPLPYTVCRKNLVFAPKLQAKLFFSGPLVRQKYEEIQELPLQKPHILSMIGGFGYRKPIFLNVLKAASLDPEIHYTLISGPNVDPLEFMDLPENVEVLQFIKDAFPYFKSSDLIIAPGGHSTMMEALSFGLPILSFPDVGHSEQENNAAVIEEENYGRRLSYTTPPEVILECIREVTEEARFRAKTERLQRLARELNGPRALRELLEKEVEKRAS